MSVAMGCEANSDGHSSFGSGKVVFSVGVLGHSDSRGGAFRFAVGRDPISPQGSNFPTVGHPDFATMRVYYFGSTTTGIPNGMLRRFQSPALTLVGNNDIFGHGIANVDFDGDGCQEGILLGSFRHDSNKGAILAFATLANGDIAPGYKLATVDELESWISEVEGIAAASNARSVIADV